MAAFNPEGFSRLPAAQKGQKDNPWRFLEETQPVKLYGANQLIYLQEETAERFYYLKSGRVRIFLSSVGGSEKTLAIAQAGSLLGEASFFSGSPRVSSAKTVEKSQIISIDRPILLESFRKRPELALELCRYLSGTIRMLSAQVDSMTFQQADQRLAELLLQLSQEAEGSSLSTPLPRVVRATHEELASLAGVSRVTVSRVLTKFAEKGWISTGYGVISLLKSDCLEFFFRRQNL